MARHTLEWQETFPDECRRGAVAVGNFDGVHRGHAALIAETCRQARDLDGPAVAVTFDPHPLELLRPEKSQPPLTTTDDRVRLLHELGADQVIVLRTTKSLLELSAADFFDRVLRERLAAHAVVEGVNFGFGHNREGNVDAMARLCRAANLAFTLVPPVHVGETAVSSSRIRTALARGDVAEAADLLGRPHRLIGTVREGARRGRTIGFPTANLDRFQTLAPGDGVYGVRAHVGAAAYRPEPDLRRESPQSRGASDRLHGRPVRPDVARRFRPTAA